MGKRKGFALLATAACAIGIVTAATGQAGPKYRFDVPSQDLKFALRSVTREAGLQLFAGSNDLRGRRSIDLHAETTVEDALNRLLVGTDLHAEIDGKAVFIRGRAEAGVESSDSKQALAQIVVTGSRIERGAVASPVVTLTQQQIRRAGQNDVGDALRSLPQSFSGGQNPGVASGIGGDNQNLSGGSSPNLRGLGADATLTLLNGHRLSYGSSIQAVDVSAIPLAAVQRVDVVADGASAVYGSDAVGGVVNIILKPDYNGFTTSARIGGATQGGDFEQQYDATGGSSWKSGGFIATYDYSRNSQIGSDQRAYTAYMPDGNTLMASRRDHSALLSGHQALGPDLTFAIDATYSHRHSANTIQQDDGYAYVNRPVDTAYSVAPSLKLAIGPDWSVSLSGLDAVDHTLYSQETLHNGAFSSLARGCYCNLTNNVELSGEGSLFHLPAGDARVALGGGYRHSTYDQYSITSSVTLPAHAGQTSYYGFGELFVPLVAPTQEVTLVRQLSLDAALRYERYPGMASVANPKLGLVYAPSRDLDLKFSWGKSFKAPTLSEESEQAYAYLYAANLLGGGRFPAGSDALLAYGGNPDLKPERATSWSTTVVAHPVAVPGLKVEATYFHIDYRNRIIQPISGAQLFTALSDPVFGSYVVLDPSEALQTAAINEAAKGLTNYTGGAYDPATVAALINDRFINAARQWIKGVDLSVSYHTDLGSAGSLDLRGLASWLDSHERLSPSAPTRPLSGTIFNPPHYKGLFAATWSYRSASLTATVNYVGGLTDISQSPHVRVGSQTTLDLVGTLDIGRDHGLLGDIGLSLAIRNAFNQRPPYATPSGGLAYYPDYDSTNYSAIGRFVGLTVTKSW
jgi:outer membrane receptor protein involved in Fe transport